MGQVSLGANALDSATGPHRFRIPEQAFDLADPIKKIDEAVRAVLAELRPKSPSRIREESDCQVIVDRLFSLRHAEALPPGTRIVRLGPATVATPLARDLLKRKGIMIRLGDPGESFSSARGEWAFSIAADAELLGTVKAVRRALLDDPRVWIEFEPTLDFLTNWLAEGNGRGAMYITTEGSLAVWQSCQITGVRAAMAAEPGEVYRAVAVARDEPARGRAGRKIDFMDQATRRSFPSLRSARAPDSLLAEDRR